MNIDPLDNRSNLNSSPDLLNDPSNFPFFDPPFIEEMHALTGTTHTENMRHVIARIELLYLLYEDPQMIARIKTWGNDIGLIQAAEELASVLDSLAQCCGLAHRADIFRPEQDPEAMTTRDEARDNELSQPHSLVFSGEALSLSRWA
jgi:hypothetical protein